MTYPEALQELIEEFQSVEDKRERLEMLFELADEVLELPQDQWSEETRVKGCQSEAHVRISINEGRIQFLSSADARMVQGLMGILTIALDGLTPAQAVLIPPSFAEEMGLLNTLTPSRSNGFRNMYDKVMAELRL
ncbi:MAG: cysteine desulfuration protein SufE [Euryarchaeota archaeon]|nr:cysteine desulfuration protein SufE [Euryarchaeota archaeon]|tara:strand:+ start:200 stop:604 length:405 start_codon:yes stop_codon:yes gene_type:complete